MAVLACVALIVLVYLFSKFCMPKCHNLIKKLCIRVKHMLMFNSILRYFMMIYLSITTGCCLVLHEAIVNPT